MFKQVTLTNKCLAIVMQRSDSAGCNDRQNRHRSANNRSSAPENGYRIFQEFQEENRASFWNPGLVQSVNALEFVGFVRPGTLFVSSSEINLECLRGAWARRVLKPPPGFNIKGLGDIGGIEMQEVPQTQFIPLAEVLCLIVSNLNRVGKPATLTEIVAALTEEYDGMCIPKHELLYATLGALIAEGKLYCMGEHYFIPTPTMFHYYQRQFLRRTAMPSQTACLWMKENETNCLGFPQKSNISRGQEMCSRECQTGASIVAGQPPYVPPTKKDQATSAQTQIVSQPASVPNGVKLQRPTKLDGNKEKENKGFLSRLFGRTKPKQSNGTYSKTAAGKPNAALQNDHIIDSPSTSGPASHLPNSIPATIPMATFSAQFPPPEWLCDPRLVKTATAKDATQPHSQEPFLSKIRRTCKQQPQNGPPISSRDQQRHSVWVDPIDCVQGKSTNFNRKERNDPKRFSSQRHHGRLQQGHVSPNDHYDRSNKHRHRLSKYLSSSSECLRQSPLHNKKSSDAEKRISNRYNHDRSRPQQNFSVYHFADQDNQQPRSFNNGQANTKIAPTTTSKDTDEYKGRPIMERTEKQGAVVSRIPPLVLPTDGELDGVSDCAGQRTSTPTPVKQCIAVGLESEMTSRNMELDYAHGQMKQLKVDAGRGNRDSAYSASPIVTEMSSSDGKYSSWSGSDGQRENRGTVTAANHSESIGGKPEVADQAILVVDNTYVNDTTTRIRALDHTYQNLDHPETVSSM